MRIEKEQDPYAFKHVPSNPYVIELTGCKSYRDVHQAIKNGLGFHDYYGENLDALWDLGYDFCCGRPLIVEFRGTQSLPKDAKELFKGIWGVFIDLHKEFPNVQFVIVS